MSELAHWTIRVAVVALCCLAILALLCWRVSSNDHAKILRDQRVKAACIASGQSVVAGNCVPVVSS